MQEQEPTPSLELDQNHLGGGLLEQVAGSALSRLSRFSALEESKIRQTFLFAANRLCGIRLEAGSFQARWQLDDSTIQITRGQQIVDQIPFLAEINRAA